MKGKTIKTTLFAAGVLLMSTPLVAAADTEGQVQEQIQEQATDQIQVVEENKVGWVQTEDGSWEYYLENNQGRVIDAWRNIEGVYYQFDNNGYLVNKTGWEYTDNNWRYFEGTRGVATKSWRYIDGKWYEFNNNGYLVNKTGWEYVNGQWMYYEGTHGVATNGWRYINGKWYEFNNNGYLVNKTGWEYVNGQWMYYEGTSGVATNGWRAIKGTWYEFNNEGYLVNKTGWVQSNGKWMYYEGTGGVATNAWRYIDGRWYQFDSSGYWIDKSKGVIDLAKKMIGVPYRWGGSSPSGFDCSGFIYYVYSRNGYSITRMDVASYWAKASKVKNPQPGDLVFLQNTYKAGPSHLGIYIGNGQYIHAGNNGVTTTSVNSSYTRKHFLGYGSF
ncbi:NlpC/P60 family protein [Bacillus manliponensis]|uniref:NlpC/P60 family protein n=1 Tax=Bacillus manliponensis TaxID=574376 RepID=UPI003515858A